jgi:FtsH-binding integral membrane protein
MSFQQTRAAGATFEGVPGQVAVAQESVPVRMAFLKKVYALFSFAMLIWAGSGTLVAMNESIANAVLGFFQGGIGLILFMVVGFIFMRVTAKRFPLNLIGLAVFATIFGVITGASAYGYAAAYGGYEIVLKSFILTACIFGGLTAYVLMTKKDFSFMGAGLSIATTGAAGLMLLFYFFGVGGTVVPSTGFAIAMVLLYAGWTVYDTSNIVRRYPADMAASAASAIFMDFVLMFLWVMRAFGGGRD